MAKNSKRQTFFMESEFVRRFKKATKRDANKRIFQQKQADGLAYFLPFSKWSFRANRR